MDVMIQRHHHVEMKTWRAWRFEGFHPQSFGSLADEEEVGEVAYDGLEG